MATAKISLMTVKTLKDGTHPIYLVLTIHRNRKKFNLNRSCHSKYWDSKNDLPGEAYPQKYKGGQDEYKKSILVKYLQTRLTDARSIISEFERDGRELSFTEFENRFHQKLNKETSVYQFFESEIQRLKDSGQYGYSLVYSST